MPKVHIPDLPWEEQKSPSGKFHSFYRNVSVALGGIRNAGTWGGGHPFDVQLRRIPPGAAVCPFHSHLAQWEMFVLQSGEGMVRAGDTVVPVTGGEVFFHPPGEAHQLTNTGAGDLHVLIIADNPVLDAFHYPDSDKWGMRPPGDYFRIVPTGYYDDEDAPPPGEIAAPYQPSGSPPRPKLVPFQSRKLDPARLPWVPWESPAHRFRGASKQLSLALGALRDTPAGLGGHPFDLELSKLEPGRCGCPFHLHVAQWELFMVLSGRATVRTPQGSSLAGPGDVVLHPPGEAHQITNAGEEELMFFVIADNPPVDACFYPDSDKWDIRSAPHMLKATDADYWDGEE